MPSPSFLVGPIPVYGDLILAPMDGLSDLPFRSLCREYGSAMSYTPFVNAIELLAGTARARRGLDFLPGERPVVFQLFDSDQERLLGAAQASLALAPDIIDINMGCSVRSVSGRGAGAGLLRDPAKVGRLVARLARALPVPVTAKIRLGWDDASRNHVQVARAIADNGGALIAVHARTRQQGYTGRADWDAIAEVKASIPIPVAGNGDVTCRADIQRLKAHTGCDAVMIGRGALGNPWIFQRRDRADIPAWELSLTLRRHLEAMRRYYGEAQALRLFRKHLARYLEPLGLPPALRHDLLTCEAWPRFEALLGTAGVGYVDRLAAEARDGAPRTEPADSWHASRPQ